jgi:hypothetical protein
MIHHSVGPWRKVARVIAAVGGPLWAIIAGSLPNPASAGGAAPGLQPLQRGSYCEGSDQDLTPPGRGAGCARINGYIAAGARFGSEERIGGRPDLFAPLNEPGIAGGRASGFKTVGAPLGEELFFPRLSSDDEAR